VRVLLVDDHPDTAESLQILLERHGFQVRVARCVKEAVEEAKQSCDLLISDLQLPDGSGHDIVRTLSKPVPVTDLLAAIERALTRAPLPGAARVP
jgi:DNA-binding response OmpR family regulator